MDYYIQDRHARQDYERMLPLLKGLRKQKVEELEWESQFIELVAHRNNVSKELVQDCVDWWKHKVIWKRPIMKDDAKALRMIEGRVKRLNK